MLLDCGFGGVAVVWGCCKQTNVGNDKIGGVKLLWLLLQNFSAGLPNQIWNMWRKSWIWFIAGLARLILRLWHSKGWSAGGSMEWRGASSIAILQVRFRLETMFECGGWSLMDGIWRGHTPCSNLDGFIYPFTNFWLCEQVVAQWPGRIIYHFKS